MAIKISVSDIVGIKIEATINAETGAAKPYEFGLTCTRHTSEEIDDKLAGDYSAPAVMAFMLEVIKGWSGVRSEDDKTAVPYSEDNFRALCKTAGVLFLAFKCYREQVGVKAKN